MTPEEYSVLKDYLKSGKHLPKEFRDFHNQNDLFKLIGGCDVRCHESMPPEIINWRQGQVYVIDYFLWFMATYGYELRKVKSKIPRKDLNEDQEIYRKRLVEAMREDIFNLKKIIYPEDNK